MDPKYFTSQIEALSALDDPVRRKLFLFVGSRGEASRDQAARAVGVSRSLAAFHLDKLVDAGVLVASFRRLTGRTGPGAGRPSKLYRRSGLEIDLTVPQRRYEWAAQVMTRAIAANPSEESMAVLRRSARAQGESIGRDLTSAPGKPGGRAAAEAPGTVPALRVAARALGVCGFEPSLAREGQVVLRNCPFAALREGCREVVCGMNLALIEGVISGMGLEGVTAKLEPQPDTCCVALRAAPTGDASEPPPTSA